MQLRLTTSTLLTKRKSHFAAKLTAVAVSVLGVALAQPAQPQLTLAAPIPAAAVPGGIVVGTPGPTPLFYWVVARFPIGTVTSNILIVPGTVGEVNLTTSNFVTIQWPSVPGATGYDVIRRQNSQVFPSSCNQCAVAINTVSTTANDQGPGSAYSLPAPAATPATGILNLNNIGEPAPYLQLALNGLQYRIMPFSGPYTVGDVPMFAVNGVLVDSGGTGGGGGGGVPSGRLINTASPLTGGGSLAADLNLGINQATTSTNGYLSSADWNTFNGRQPSGAYITGLTGDGTASGPGNVSLTLATVNISSGACTTDNAHVCLFTTNAKGLVTTQSSVAILGGNAVLNNQANTYSGGGLQNFGAVDLLLPLHAVDPVTCTPGQIEFNTTGTVTKVCTAANTWSTSATGSLTMYVAGAPVGTQPGLNFISGNGLTQSCVNNGGASRVDCTPDVNFAVAESIALSQSGKDTYCDSTTGTNSYSCSLGASSLLTAYTKGMFLNLTANAACPAACSLTVDGLGAINIKQIDGTTDPTGQIAVGRPVLLFYDGSVFRIESFGGGGSGGGTVTTSGSPAIHQVAIFSGATAITGIAVGATDRPFVGLTASDPLFSNLILTNPATTATFTLANNKTFLVNNSLTLIGTDLTSMTFPGSSAVIARTDAANTFSGIQSFAGSLIAGTDNSVAGTFQLANSAANAHTVWASGATTTNIIAGFTVAPTTGDLLSCTTASVTCTLTDAGIVAANVMTAAGTLTSNVFLLGGGSKTAATSSYAQNSGNIQNTSTGNTSVFEGGQSGSSNSALGGATVRGATMNGTNNTTSADAGNLLAMGGDDNSPNAAAKAGAAVFRSGQAYNVTPALQGTIWQQASYAKGATVTQWNLQCISGTTSMTTVDCGASPATILGVAEVTNTGGVLVTFAGQTLVNASAAVTVGDTVCAGTTAGKVTDSGGLAACVTGITVGTVIATSGTFHALPDGTAITPTTTLPLIAMFR